MLITNKIFICMTLILCSIYFVGSGIQYWITAYLLVVLRSNPVDVLMYFSITAITSPLAGALVGGYIADHYGGYKGENLPVAVRLSFLFGILGFIFAIPIGFVNSIIYVIPLLWCFFFFGGCLIPTATGISVNSVNREYQSTATSFSQLIFNLGGYFLAPISAALIMDSAEDEI